MGNERVDDKNDTDILVKDILNLKGNEIYSIDAEETLPVAVSKMVEKDVGSLMVTKRHDGWGQITFYEILRAIKDSKGNLKCLQVKDVMVEKIEFGHPEDSMKDVKTLMMDKKIRYLPILDNDTLVGIMSFRDIARAALSLATHENSMLKRYIKNWPGS